jgi:putative transposase
LLTEAHGIALAVAIDGANRHDMKLVKPTLADLKLPAATDIGASPGSLPA